MTGHCGHALRPRFSRNVLPTRQWSALDAPRLLALVTLGVGTTGPVYLCFSRDQEGISVRVYPNTGPDRVVFRKRDCFDLMTCQKLDTGYKLRFYRYGENAELPVCLEK
ncbi:hypothetical protein PoB_006532800 [Plakobranchus ocellatus]|uniref:Uncharacterized protein n=1 Tax=Plakobranchus ocellatus TaxID=259542 RepID=A0AAV4D3X8_9GAST|nr:hypothetical protein PoB_006532800 [Plakobranchus ocellatus]